MKSKHYSPPQIWVLSVLLENSINAASINSGNSTESNTPYVENFIDDQTVINTGTNGFDI